MKKLNPMLAVLLLWFSLFFQQLVVSTNAEVLDITSDGTWSCSSSSTECSMIVDSDCDGSCSGSEYHCPNNGNTCTLCQLYCNGEKDACKDGIFYSYSCQQVNIITNTSSDIDHIFEKIIIHAPIDGTLNVTFGLTGKNAFKGGRIYSYNTKNIYFNLNQNDATNVGEDAIIYASDVTNNFIANLFGDFKKSTLYCPLTKGSKCIINCIGNIANDMCKEMNIYTRYGLNNNLLLSLQQFFFQFFFFVSVLCVCFNLFFSSCCCNLLLSLLFSFISFYFFSFSTFFLSFLLFC